MYITEDTCKNCVWRSSRPFWVVWIIDSCTLNCLFNSWLYRAASTLERGIYDDMHDDEECILTFGPAAGFSRPLFWLETRDKGYRPNLAALIFGIPDVDRYYILEWLVLLAFFGKGIFAQTAFSGKNCRSILSNQVISWTDREGIFCQNVFSSFIWILLLWNSFIERVLFFYDLWILSTANYLEQVVESMLLRNSSSEKKRILFYFRPNSDLFRTRSGAVRKTWNPPVWRWRLFST